MEGRLGIYKDQEASEVLHQGQSKKTYFEDYEKPIDAEPGSFNILYRACE